MTAVTVTGDDGAQNAARCQFTALTPGIQHVRLLKNRGGMQERAPSFEGAAQRNSFKDADTRTRPRCTKRYNPHGHDDDGFAYVK